MLTLPLVWTKKKIDVEQLQGAIFTFSLYVHVYVLRFRDGIGVPTQVAKSSYMEYMKSIL